jgi:hypothetical protein
MRAAKAGVAKNRAASIQRFIGVPPCRADRRGRNCTTDFLRNPYPAGSCADVIVGVTVSSHDTWSGSPTGRGARPYTEFVMPTIESLSDGRSTTLVLTGTLTGHDLPALERCWKNARSQGRVQVDVCDVKEIDDAGKGLLARSSSTEFAWR